LAWIAGSCTAERCDPRQANPREAADQPGSRECLGIAGGRWVVEFVVVIVVVRQNRGEAFGACDGSGWRMGRRSGACVVGVVRHTLPIMTRQHPCCRYRLACFVQCWSIGVLTFDAVRWGSLVLLLTVVWRGAEEEGNKVG